MSQKKKKLKPGRKPSGRTETLYVRMLPADFKFLHTQARKKDTSMALLVGDIVKTYRKRVNMGRHLNA